jgi:hypothetical protein
VHAHAQPTEFRSVCLPHTSVPAALLLLMRFPPTATWSPASARALGSRLLLTIFCSMIGEPSSLVAGLGAGIESRRRLKQNLSVVETKSVALAAGLGASIASSFVCEAVCWMAGIRHPDSRGLGGTQASAAWTLWSRASWA